MRAAILLLLLLMSCAPLAIIPAAAADYTLDIFGNANMDDTIDEDDIAYVEGIIKGTNERTELADANYDSEVDEDDITRIEQIIRGEEKQLTIIDTAGNIVTIDKPLERVAVLNWNTLEAMRSLKLENEKIICVSKSTIGKEKFFPEFKDSPSAGSGWSPDIEK
jgi:hypothetical protein